MTLERGGTGASHFMPHCVRALPVLIRPCHHRMYVVDYRRMQVRAEGVWICTIDLAVVQS